jgi:hypothetical protein
MNLTTTQISAIKFDIDSTPELSKQAKTADGADEIARLYNEVAEPEFLVWRTNAKVADIFDVLSWASFTPTDAPDETLSYANRLLAAQTKLFSLQSMLQGRELINASKANVRQALLDLVTSLPTGSAGAMASAGGVGGVDVLAACTRKGTRIEKLLSDSHAPLGGVSAYVMGFEGPISYEEVQIARGLN